MGGVVHKELYHLLYSRVAADAPVAILLFRKRPLDLPPPSAKPASRGSGHSRHAPRESERDSAKSKQLFEEKCGGCSKPSEITTYGADGVQGAETKRLWVQRQRA
jgi:hypothetical protein